MNIVIFGDSITWGGWDREGGWVARLQKSVTEEVLLRRNEVFQARVPYIYNSGRSGDTTEHLLERFDVEVQARLTAGNSAGIIFQVGVNDSVVQIDEDLNRVPLDQFAKNIEQLIAKAKKRTNNVLFVGLLPVQEEKVNPIPWKEGHAYMNTVVQEYNQVLLNVCEQHNVDCIDVYDQFSELAFDTYLLDGVHPNDEGHRMLYERIHAYVQAHSWLDILTK